MLSGLCLSNGITLVLGLEHVGWSLFVRDYTSPRSKVIPSDKQRPPNILKS
jgi:hypothetical protein